MASCFCRRKNPPPIHETPRDVAVLQAVDRLGYVSGEQLRQLVLDCGRSRAAERLRALYDHRYLNRLPVPDDHGQGSPRLVYTLGSRGAKLLRQYGHQVSQNSHPVGPSFLRHHLGLIDLYITFRQAAADSVWEISGWTSQPRLTDTAKVCAPHSDQPFVLTPDAYFTLASPVASYGFFLELDLSTHAQRVWRQRAQLFVAYANLYQEEFYARFQRRTWRLLIVTKRDWRGRSRCDNILATIYRTVGDTDLFLATTLPQLSRQTVLQETIWRLPGSARPVPLLPPALAGGEQTAFDGWPAASAG